MPKTYFVADVEIFDRTEYEKYVAANPTDTVLKYGGRYVVRSGGADSEILEGDTIRRITILEFPSREACKQWYNGPEYREFRRIRDKGARVRAWVMNGAD